MADDVLALAIVNHLEIPVMRTEPPVRDRHYPNLFVAKGKGAGFLFPLVAGIAVNLNIKSHLFLLMKGNGIKPKSRIWVLYTVKVDIQY